MPRAQTYLTFSLGIHPVLHNRQMGCDAIFLKQTLQNKYWVTQIALYPCMRLATLQVCWIEKKKCALGQQFSKILKGSAKQEVSECCNHSSWLRLTRKQVREVLCSAALPPTPQPSPPPGGHSRERGRSQMQGQTHFSVCIVDCRAWYGGWTFSNTFFSVEKMM